MTAERFHMQEVRVSQLIPMVANFVAIFILIFGVYFPRHRRRDMIVAYLAINTGVLAIAAVLSSVDTSVGLAELGSMLPG
jgi:predicted MFS family arabinose efflux permease